MPGPKRVWESIVEIILSYLLNPRDSFNIFTTTASFNVVLSMLQTLLPSTTHLANFFSKHRLHRFLPSCLRQ